MYRTVSYRIVFGRSASVHWTHVVVVQVDRIRLGAQPGRPLLGFALHLAENVLLVTIVFLSDNSHTYCYLVFHHPLTLSFQA